MSAEPLAAGREAIGRYAWEEAFEQLSAADASGDLAAGDLEHLGDAAFWLGRLRDCIRFRERSAAAYTQAGDRLGAARVSLALAGTHFGHGNVSVGGGWLGKAQRLLEEEAESAEHGELDLWRAQILIFRGDLDGARSLSM